MRTARILLFLLCCHTTYGALTPSLSKPCGACHGTNGQSLNPAWPHLAGQETDYLNKQLQDLKNGNTRHVDEGMAPFLSALTSDDITTLAEFYAKQPRSTGSHRLRRKNKQGEALYQQGNPDKQILPCITCHGLDAKGNGLPGFPSLRGQQIKYTIHQLEAFKAGERKNDPGNTMQQVAKNLSEEDIYALAYYLASLSK